jgi:hypothetical protein
VIEVIDKLLPLLESAGEGAFFLAVMLIAGSYLKYLLIAAVPVSIALLGYKLISQFTTAAQYAREVFSILDRERMRREKTKTSAAYISSGHFEYSYSRRDTLTVLEDLINGE